MIYIYFAFIIGVILLFVGFFAFINIFLCNLI